MNRHYLIGGLFFLRLFHRRINQRKGDVGNDQVSAGRFGGIRCAAVIAHVIAVGLAAVIDQVYIVYAALQLSVYIDLQSGICLPFQAQLKGRAFRLTQVNYLTHIHTGVCRSFVIILCHKQLQCAAGILQKHCVQTHVRTTCVDAACGEGQTIAA